jgi:hypothetical protein
MRTIAVRLTSRIVLADTNPRRQRLRTARCPTSARCYRHWELCGSLGTQLGSIDKYLERNTNHVLEY